MGNKQPKPPRGQKRRVMIYLEQGVYEELRVRGVRNGISMSKQADRYIKAGLRAEGVEVDR